MEEKSKIDRLNSVLSPVVAMLSLVVAIIGVVVMVKIYENTEALRKAEKLHTANAMFESANNTDQYLAAYNIYREIFLNTDSIDNTSGYFKFVNKAKERINQLPKDDKITVWLLERAKELTKEKEQIENIDNLLKECKNEKN